ncbi:MAG: heme-binding domain-containing protein, partial [Planctomycetes bacterium]|nr:heme-binding domain-containing protein [Planctomycetota bacterium]
MTGGYVYRGSRTPSLFGAYLYADFISGRVWALVHDGQQVLSNTEIASVPNPSSFGEDRDGEVYLCSFDGGIYRLDETGGPAPFPQTLSATGLFSNTAALRAAPGLIEYDVNAPLWSDDATKRRWIALPGSSRITFRATGSWDFPVGTILVKHFELTLSPGVVRRLETRVLVNHSQGWAGYTYRWNGAQTDATLLADRFEEEFTVSDPTAPGGLRQQTWTYPSRADCLSCHTAASGRVLGIRTNQINREFDYPARPDNQLRAWNHIDLFTADPGEASSYGALPDPLDEGAAPAPRARAYLEANCAMCHLPGGPTPVEMDLRAATPVGATGTRSVAATNPVDGSPGALRIAPGIKEQSDLWERLRRMDGYRMPPLASHVVDAEAVDLIGLWSRLRRRRVAPPRHARNGHRDVGG